LDGRASFKKNIETRGLLKIMRAVIAGLHDSFRTVASYPAVYYPLTGTVDEFAFMQLEQEEAEAYAAKQPDQKQVEYLGAYRYIAGYIVGYTVGCIAGSRARGMAGNLEGCIAGYIAGYIAGDTAGVM
jgi:hypothetical protein